LEICLTDYRCRIFHFLAFQGSGSFFNPR